MSHLAWASIGELVDPISSWTPARDDPNGVFTYVDLGAVDQDAKLVTGARELWCSEAPSRARQLLLAGDVLISTVRPNLNAVACLPSDLNGATASTGFCVLRPDEQRLDRRFLFQWVKSPPFVGEMVRRATGASYPAVSDRIVCESRIPFPPLAEQRRIAAILDKADALRAKRRAAIAQLDTLTQSIFLEMFGDPATNPKGWPVMALGATAAKFSDGPFGSNLKSAHYTEPGVRVIRLQNIGIDMFVDDDAAYISEYHFHRLIKHQCLPGDVLVGTLGDPNLRACIQPDWLAVALNKADCVQIRADEAVAEAVFICALLNQPATERMAQGLMLGQTRTRISMGRLRGLEVPIPPLVLQREFCRRVSAIMRQRDLHQRSAQESAALFAALQSRAFRGEL